MNVRDKIMALHACGFSNAEIARKIGVSRQRVWEVLHTEEREQELDPLASPRLAPEKSDGTPMSIADVAALLGVHPNTVRRWSDKGMLPCFRLGPRQDRRFEPKRVVEVMYKAMSN